MRRRASASRSSTARSARRERNSRTSCARIYLTDADDYEQIAARTEVFGEIEPASTAVVVKGLLDPRWRVEIEADAVLP